MELKASYCIIFILFVCGFKTQAQTHETVKDAPVLVNKKTTNGLIGEKQIILSTSLNNDLFQYERFVNKKTSVSLSLKIMSGFTLPLKNLTIHAAGQNDPNMVQTIENVRLQHCALTAELRYYLSKKQCGKGFYIAPFFRHEGFKTNELLITFADNRHTNYTMKLAGKLTSYASGILVGANWNAGKHICLNWWIMGPQAGSGKGHFTALSDQMLDTKQQQNLQKELNDLDFHQIKKTVEVSNNKVSLKLNGLWTGVRCGVSINVKY